MMIKEYLNTKSALVDTHLNQLIPENLGCPHHLAEAARYSLLGAGKRLRPILVLATTEMAEAKQEKAMASACALEMIHTYSLVHDDLPCMDDDDFRRGKPSLHKAYTEGHAVLTGDFLLTHAFGVVADDEYLSPKQKVSIISILSKQAGGQGMIGGQVMDLFCAGKKIDLPTLEKIHLCKTASIIAAAMEIGAIVGDLSPEQQSTLRLFGEKIGLAFQVIDDVLDVTASEEKHGKAISSDVLNDKTTYVTLLGLEQAQATAQQLLQEAVELLAPLPYDSADLLALAHFVVNRRK